MYAGDSENIPFYVHALTVNSYIQSAYKCMKGGSQISKLLIRKLREHGADVHKYSEVSEFIFNDNVLSSVKTKSGKEYFAKQFISNIEIRSLTRLIGEDRLKKSFFKQSFKLGTCFVMFQCLFGFKTSDNFQFQL